MNYINNKTTLFVFIVSFILGLCAISTSSATSLGLVSHRISDRYYCNVDTNNITQNNVAVHWNYEKDTPNDVKIYVYDGKIKINQKLDLLSVTDITGRTIIKSTNVNEVDFPYNRGIYIITTIKGNKINTFKISL